MYTVYDIRCLKDVEKVKIKNVYYYYFKMYCFTKN